MPLRKRTNDFARRCRARRPNPAVEVDACQESLRVRSRWITTDIRLSRQMRIHGEIEFCCGARNGAGLTDRGIVPAPYRLPNFRCISASGSSSSQGTMAARWPCCLARAFLQMPRVAFANRIGSLLELVIPSGIGYQFYYSCFSWFLQCMLLAHMSTRFDLHLVIRFPVVKNVTKRFMRVKDRTARLNV